MGLSMRDIFRTDGNARQDALRRVVQMLLSAREVSGAGDALPTSVTPKHAAMCLALASGASIQEAATQSGLSKRSCERYRTSMAVTLVVSELRKQRYDDDLRGNADAIAKGVPLAIEALVNAASAGNVNAAREVLRLGTTLGDLERSDHNSTERPGIATEDWTLAQITMTTDPSYPDLSMTTTPPATSSKAEEHPSLPPPEYLRSIEPMWSVGAVKENDDAPLPLPGDEK